SSRSSWYCFTNGRPLRAVTFQSMERTSSPGWYSRTSENSIPRPRNTLWYSPENTSLTSLRVRISSLRTRRKFSRARLHGGGSSGPWKVRFRKFIGGSGDLDLVQDPLRHFLGRDLLGLRLVGDQDAVPQHVQRDGLDVLGRDVAAPAQERVGPRGLRQGQRGPRRGAVGDQPAQVEAVSGRVARGQHQAHDVLLDLLVHVDPAGDLAGLEDVLDPHHRAHLRGLRAHALEDLVLLLAGRVADLELEQEAVHLGLG